MAFDGSSISATTAPGPLIVCAKHLAARIAAEVAGLSEKQKRLGD